MTNEPKDSRPFVMIDGFNLSLDKGTGVATYARNLASTLRSMGNQVGVLYGGAFSSSDPPLMQEISFFDPEPPPEGMLRQIWKRGRSLLHLPSNHAFEVPITGKVITDQFRSRLPDCDSIWNARNLFLKSSTQFEVLGTINRVTPTRKPDICHWTYPLPLHMPGVPNIYTLHDLVPLRLPYTTLDKKRKYLKLLTWICNTADHIVTVSENSRRDIIDILGVNPDKVTNTYQAVTIPDALRLKPEEQVRQEVENTFGLQHKEYFLFFGSIEPKKNIGRLIEAYLTSGVSTPLVIVGAQAWRSEAELRMLKAENLKQRLANGSEAGGRILQLEYAPLSLLVSLIRSAKAVLFPSLYEGFGLPILESMLLGTPVLTSRVSSIPEIAANACLLVNPYSSQEIAAAIRSLDEDRNLRESFAAAGRQRAARFTEAAYATELTKVYTRIIGGTGKAGRLDS